jgi:tetratricopeptide (TPR) repeat protein
LVEAEYFSGQGQHQQASELYQLAITKGAGADAKLSLARSMERSGRVDDAVNVLEAAIEQHPNNQGLLVTTAMLHQQNGNQSEAVKVYEWVLDAYPENPLALNNLAWIYFEQGNNRAAELSQQAYNLSPENAAIADTHGWILFKSGNTQESLPILEKAHELAPDSQEIALHLVEAYRAMGRNSDAKRILEKLNTSKEG